MAAGNAREATCDCVCGMCGICIGFDGQTAGNTIEAECELWQGRVEFV